jgi:hypothetical protein
MIEIRATQDEADLSGSVEDLRGLREAILRLIDSSDRTLVVAASSSLDPSPYAFALPKLMVVRSSGPSQVQVENQQVLIVSGADENLARFASWFDFDPEATVGVHAHFEHLPGNPYVAHDSLPLIVSVSAEAQQALGGDAKPRAPQAKRWAL